MIKTTEKINTDLSSYHNPLKPSKLPKTTRTNSGPIIFLFQHLCSMNTSLNVKYLDMNCLNYGCL